MSAKLKILMIGPRPPQLGGIEFVVDDLLKSKLVEWSQVYHLDTSKPKSRSHSQFKSVSGYARSFRRPLRISFYSFGYSIIALLKILMRLAFGGDQIVNLHSAAYMSFWEKCLFLDLAKLFRKKVVVHIHGSNFDRFVQESRGLQRRLLHAHLRRFDCVIALSPLWVKFFADYLPADKIGLSENGIQTEAYAVKVADPAPFPCIVFVGEVCQRKGIYDLLDIMPNLVAQLPAVKLIVAGPGEIDQVRQKAENLNLLMRVEFVGPQFGLNKLKFLQQGWCFCLPSYAEVFPVVIIEAMACGLPVVSTQIGGIPDAVVHNETGLLVSAGDRQGLEAALLRILTDQEVRLRMGRQGKQRAFECYDVNMSAAKLQSIYQRVASLP